MVLGLAAIVGITIGAAIVVVVVVVLAVVFTMPPTGNRLSSSSSNSSGSSSGSASSSSSTPPPPTDVLVFMQAQQLWVESSTLNPLNIAFVNTTSSSGNFLFNWGTGSASVIDQYSSANITDNGLTATCTDSQYDGATLVLTMATSGGVTTVAVERILSGSTVWSFILGVNQP